MIPISITTGAGPQGGRTSFPQPQSPGSGTPDLSSDAVAITESESIAENTFLSHLQEVFAAPAGQTTSSVQESGTPSGAAASDKTKKGRKKAEPKAPAPPKPSTLSVGTIKKAAKRKVKKRKRGLEEILGSLQE